MRYPLGLLLCLACAPPKQPEPAAFSVTGTLITAAEHKLLIHQHVAVHECLRAHEFPIVRQVREVHVHPTCWIHTPWGWRRGWDRGERVEVGRDLRTYRHELAAALTNAHTHRPGAPELVCEHAGENAPKYRCEPKPGDQR